MGSRPAWPHRVSSNSVTVREPLCQTNKKQTDNKTTTIVTKREKKREEKREEGKKPRGSGALQRGSSCPQFVVIGFRENLTRHGHTEEVLPV